MVNLKPLFRLFTGSVETLFRTPNLWPIGRPFRQSTIGCLVGRPFSNFSLIMILGLALVPGWPLVTVLAQEDAAQGVRLAPGMEITKVASDELATNIFCMTVNSLGETVVSGPGYVKTLHDSDDDGVFDKVTVFANGPASGAQGMFFEGNDLLCTGDRALLRYRDGNADGIADGPPEKLLPLKTGGEHMAHAVRRGADGWLYILCGNQVPILKEYFDGPNSPVKDPRSGFLMRISPDWKQREIVAHGFRNAYDFDWNSLGELFIYDSDGERDISLPWYRPTRVFQIRPGDDAGWVSASWKRPSHYFDMPQEIGALGRGSPTGVTCNQHWALGNEYEDALFVADWTFGRIVVFKKNVTRDYDRGSDFAVATGQFGFAVTDIEVAPDGSLLVSVGGRGTEGGVYRIENVRPIKPYLEPGLPFSSWGQEQWIDRELDWETVPVTSDEFTVEFRTLLIQQTTYRAGAAPVKLLQRATGRDKPDDVSAALVRSVTLGPWNNEVVAALADALRTNGSRTQLAVLESLVGRNGSTVDCSEDALKQLADAIRSRTPETRPVHAQLLLNAMKHWPEFANAYSRESNLLSLANLADWINRKGVDVGEVGDADSEYRQQVIESCLNQIFNAENVSESQRDMAIRKAQLFFGGCGPREKQARMFDGFSRQFDFELKPDAFPDFQQKFKEAMPPLTKRHKAEIKRLSCMMGPAGICLFDREEDSSAFDLEEDIRWLIQVAQIEAKAPLVSRTTIADKLLHLGQKVASEGRETDRNWNARLRELVSRLIQIQPELVDSLLDHELYGLEDHVFVHDAIPGARKPDSAAVFQKNAATNPKNVTVAQLRIAAKSNRLNRELFREFARRPSLTDEAIIALAKRPELMDWEFYRQGLTSFNPSTIKFSAIALRRLGRGSTMSDDGQILAVALSASERVAWDQQGVAVRDQLVMLMQSLTGQALGYEKKSPGKNQIAVIQVWRTYLTKKYPQFVGSKQAVPGFAEVFDDVNWKQGDASKGRRLYSERQCARCHDEGTRLGPKLGGVTQRFSKHDLFRSIVAPDEQIPDRYRAVMIQTTDGELITGTSIYQSVDGITLMDANGKTYRINKGDIEAQRRSAKSLMPTGLLDGLGSEDWAHLYAFLKSK